MVENRLPGSGEDSVLQAFEIACDQLGSQSQNSAKLRRLSRSMLAISKATGDLPPENLA